ncbi:transposase, partial [Pseudomonas savastanoi pv. phaseolicola]
LVKPKVARDQLVPLIAQLPPCLIGMEACSGAHHWARVGVLPDGTRDILGIWIESTEGAKFWMKVFNDLKTRGV